MIKRFLIFLILVAIVIACNKDDDNVPDIGEIQFNATIIDSISYKTIIVTTSLIKSGGVEILQHGHCWSTSLGPTINDQKTSLGKLSSLVNFSSKLTGLTENTTYYIRAYFSTNNETLYAEEVSATTLKTGIPRVTTSDISNLSYNAVTTGGIVVSDSGLTITSRGVCWNTSGNPTLDNYDGITSDSSGTGSFVSQITGLVESTTYYFRAYASNDKGTGYGEVVNCITPVLELPQLITMEPNYISYTEARCGGKVVSNGNAEIAARGVCWDTTGNPTLENNIGMAMIGHGSGEFSKLITGLTENTTYYVSAFATNIKGTSYGEAVSFNTLNDPCDGDTSFNHMGQEYKIVIVGTQCWMAENINAGQRIEGYLAMEDNGVVEKYCYNDDEDYCNLYGGLYQWNEMMQYENDEMAQGICPDGWHIPTDDEWKVLEGNADCCYGVGNEEWNKVGARGVDAGHHLKSISGWNSNGNGSDLLGFNALPAGYRDGNGSFKDAGDYTCFLTSTEYDDDNTWRRFIYYPYTVVFRNEIGKYSGRSVRCLKNY